MCGDRAARNGVIFARYSAVISNSYTVAPFAAQSAVVLGGRDRFLPSSELFRGSCCEKKKAKKKKKRKRREKRRVLRKDNAEDFGTRIKCDDGFTMLEWSFTVEVAGSV